MKWLLFLVLGTVSCAEPVQLASGALSKPAATFPSEAEVRALAASSGASDVKGSAGIVDVDRWAIPAPPAPPATYPDETIWDHLVQSSLAAHGNGVQLSATLRCAAHEAARFYTLNGGMPDTGLREQLLLRCGSSLPTHEFSYAFSSAPDSASATRIEAALTPLVQKLLDARFSDSRGEFGLSFARGHGHYAVVAFSGHPRAILEPYSQVVQGSSVTLSGELKVTADHLMAVANQGAYGVARCEVDSTLRLPAFRVTCPLAASDPTTRIAIGSSETGRVLLRPAVSLEVRRDENAAVDYDAAAYGANRVVASSEDFRRQVQADLNDARAKAGLRLLALEPQQSTTDQRIAPALFQAALKGDDSNADRLALSLMAGWDVHGGMIRTGGFFMSSVNTGRNPSRWLTQALAGPIGRFMLLEPGMSQIAIAETDLAPAGAMGLVTTYAFFETDNHQADEDDVLLQLNRQRVARGKREARRVASETALTRAADQVRRNVTTSDSALQNALQELRGAHGKQVIGSALETTNISQIRFTDAFLDAEALDVELSICHYRAPGAAWGQYVILFALLNHTVGNRTAENQRPGARPNAHFRPGRGPLLVYSAPP